MPDLFLDRPLPSALDAERAVLGSVLMRADLYLDAERFLAATDFYLDAHARIFTAMGALVATGAPVDPVTLGQELRRRGEYDQVGGGGYLSGLIDFIPRLENIDHYALLVRDAARKRALIRTAHGMMADAFSGEMTAADLVERAEREILRVGEDRATDGLEPIANAALEWVEHCEAVTNGEVPPGARTGVPTFDKLTGGLQRQNLVLVAARPKLGKTSFALNVAEHIASAGQPVAFFSLEMSRRELVARLLSDRARIDGHRVRGGGATSDDLRALYGQAVATTDLPLYIDDRAGSTVVEMRAKVRRLKRELGERGAGLVVFVDYLQLIRTRDRRENRTQEVSAISRDLKLLAKDEDVPVVALSQLSRAPEQRADKKPQLSDLRESGALEQDADLVVFLHAQTADMYKSIRPTELIVEAHRAGPTGVIQMTFFREYTRFEEAPQYDY